MNTTINTSWREDFISQEEAQSLGYHNKRYRYIPFHELSTEDQGLAKRAYCNKSVGAIVDFAAEHYYYPVKKNGTLGNGDRLLAISYKNINPRYLKSLGYTINPKFAIECTIDTSNWMRSHERAYLTITSPTGNSATFYQKHLDSENRDFINALASNKSGPIILTNQEMTKFKNYCK
jgi:hypothetical protein